MVKTRGGPASLNGERHKAEYLPDGRLFITFRSIERDLRKNLKQAKISSADGIPRVGLRSWRITTT